MVSRLLITLGLMVLPWVAPNARYSGLMPDLYGSASQQASAWGESAVIALPGLLALLCLVFGFTALDRRQRRNQ